MSTYPTLSIDKAAVKAGETFTVFVEFNTPVDQLWKDQFTVYDAVTGQVSSSATVTGRTALRNDDDGKYKGALYDPSSIGPYTRYWRVTLTAKTDVDFAQVCVGVNITDMRNSAGPMNDPTIYKSNSVFIDSVAPAVSSATAVGTRLVLSYSDGSGLDATHPPVAAAFGVTANGIANNVTAVLVDTSTNTVTLTLASAVSTGQTVLVSYTDPTTGDDANAVQDRAGNDAASFSNRVVTVSSDNTAPTMAAGNGIGFSKTSIKSGETTTVTFTFSEAVRGFDLSDVVVPANCTLTKPVAVNPSDGASTTWTATLTGKPNVNASDVKLSVNLSGVTDTAGNTGSGSSAASQAITVDTRLPALVAEGGIQISKTTLKTGETAEVLFTFTEDLDPASFTEADVVLSGFAAGWTISKPVGLSNGSISNTFRATLTPPANTESTSTTIAVKLDQVDDGGQFGGNHGEGTSPASSVVSANTTRPTLASSDIVIADRALTVDETSTVTFTFSQAVSGFDISDVTVENGTLSNMQALDGSGHEITGANQSSTKWSATLTPNNHVNDDSNKLSVNMTGVTNAGGNTGLGSVDSANYTVNTPRPRLTHVEFSDRSLKVGDTSTVTFTFSEAVTGFDSSDVPGVPNGSLGTMKAVDDHGNEMTGSNPISTTWRATLTPNENAHSWDTVLTVNLAGVANAAGVTGAGRTHSDTSYSVDTQRPTLADTDAIAFDKTTLKTGETATEVIFTFSEMVSGFSAAAVIGLGSNATLTNVRATYGDRDGTPVSGDNPASYIWRATLTAVDGKQSATNALSVDLSKVTDSAGNAGTGSSANSGNFVIDTLAPTVRSFTVVRSQSAAGQIATYQVQLTFSEKVSGLTAAKLVADNASITNLASSDQGMTWTATLIADKNVDDASNKVHLDLAQVTDVAGNGFANATAESDNYALDSQAPVFERAVVNGSQLVLYYAKGAGADLSAANKPGVSAFAVLADGVGNRVTGVSVDAAAGTVTLNLANSVAYGQTVSVSYTDPTTGDDVNAIQDTAGNDAASLGAQTAANSTPAPVAPAPAPAPAPDTDSDGVANNVEDQAPGLAGAARAEGNADGTGDGNGDGIPDSRQTNVASASFAIGTKDASALAGYTTLVAGGQNGKPAADNAASTHITSLLQQDTPAWLPKALEMPTGLTSFNAELAAGQTSESFSLYVAADLGINGYWMKNGEGVWVNLASAAYGGKMVSEGGKLRLDFKITDGSEFDADGLADGSIAAQGAAAHMALSVLGQAPDAARDGFWL